jgi:hypothetical protein
MLGVQVNSSIWLCHENAFGFEENVTFLMKFAFYDEPIILAFDAEILNGESAADNTFSFSTCARALQLIEISADARASVKEFLSSNTTIAPGLVGRSAPCNRTMCTVIDSA